MFIKPSESNMNVATADLLGLLNGYFWLETYDIARYRDAVMIMMMGKEERAEQNQALGMML